MFPHPVEGGTVPDHAALYAAYSPGIQKGLPQGEGGLGRRTDAIQGAKGRVAPSDNMYVALQYPLSDFPVYAY